MNDTTSPSARLREAMLTKVQQQGHARRPDVARVLRQVPRHEFVPEADLETTYNPWQAVITHRFADGTSLSCASAPFVVAMMLDQLAVEPGNTILEIGAGTGYNASLLAELTGSETNVVTIDVDPDVTAQATHNLAAAGHPGAHVVTGDGAHGVPEHAPYDRLIATVSPWDIPAAWWQQLAPGTRVVLPLRWRGQTRSVGFTYCAGRLVADSIELCGFVYLVGQDDDGEHSAPITDDETIRLHYDRDQPVDPQALHDVLDQPGHPEWSGVTIAGDEPHDGIWLRLTVTDPRVCRLNVPAGTTRAVEPISPGRAPARRPKLAGLPHFPPQQGRQHHPPGTRRHRTRPHRHRTRPSPLPRDPRLGGPPRPPQTHLITYPADTPDGELAGSVIDKTHSRLVLTYETRSADA